jgi:hypothetical protein
VLEPAVSEYKQTRLIDNFFVELDEYIVKELLQEAQLLGDFDLYDKPCLSVCVSDFFKGSLNTCRYAPTAWCCC